MKTKIVLLVFCLLTGCAKPTLTSNDTGVPVGTETGSALLAEATPRLPPMDLVPVVPAIKVILSVTNTGPASSEPFSVLEKGMYRINWQQASTGKFVLAVINTDPAKAGTPYGRVIFESTSGPSAKFSDYPFIAGQYKATVEQADGPWKVWVEYIGPVNQ